MAERLLGPQPPLGPGRARFVLLGRAAPKRPLTAVVAPPAVVSPEFALALLVYVRRRGKDLLGLDIRRRLFDHVRQYPGLHLREIARAAGVDTNHAKYHLQYLERHGLVSSQRDLGYWRFYAKQEGSVGLRETLAPQEKAVLSLLRRPVPLHAVILLLDREEIGLDELGQEMRLAHSTVLYHMAKLEAASIVESRRDGRRRIYRLREPQAVLAQLLQYRPPDALVEGFLEAWEALELP